MVSRFPNARRKINFGQRRIHLHTSSENPKGAYSRHASAAVTYHMPWKSCGSRQLSRKEATRRLRDVCSHRQQESSHLDRCRSHCLRLSRSRLRSRGVRFVSRTSRFASQVLLFLTFDSFCAIQLRFLRERKRHVVARVARLVVKNDPCLAVGQDVFVFPQRKYVRKSGRFAVICAATTSRPTVSLPSSIYWAN